MLWSRVPLNWPPLWERIEFCEGTARTARTYILRPADGRYAPLEEMKELRRSNWCHGSHRVGQLAVLHSQHKLQQDGYHSIN